MNNNIDMEPHEACFDDEDRNFMKDAFLETIEEDKFYIEEEFKEKSRSRIKEDFDSKSVKALISQELQLQTLHGRHQSSSLEMTENVSGNQNECRNSRLSLTVEKCPQDDPCHRSDLEKATNAQLEIRTDSTCKIEGGSCGNKTQKTGKRFVEGREILKERWSFCEDIRKAPKDHPQVTIPKELQIKWSHELETVASVWIKKYKSGKCL